MKIRIAIALAATLFASASGADDSKLVCPSAELFDASIITDFCWTCLFPMRALGGTIGDASEMPAGATKKVICACDPVAGVPTSVGIVAGMYQPATIYETTVVPYCSPTMGGLRMSKSFFPLGGRNTDSQNSAGQGEGFLNIHGIAFPLMEITNLLVGGKCTVGGYEDIDVVSLSEINPCWSDPEMSLYCEPDAQLFTSSLAQLAGLIDGPAASIGKPIDDIYWYAGTWGSVKPATGHISDGRNPVRDSSLAVARQLSEAHRIGTEWRTMGDDTLCDGGQYFPHLKKSQYRMSMVWPVAESSGHGVPFSDITYPQNSDPGTQTGTTATDYNQPTQAEQQDISTTGTWTQLSKCCHHIGESTFKWGEWRNRPAKEDHVYMVNQWVDCCYY